MEDFDLDNLKEIFLQECGENLDTLENGLLRMGEGEDDADLLNEVFRAAHSIKGGAATLGFSALAELTHHMETLLDEMRSGKREVNEDDVEILLSSLDVLREILDMSIAGDDSEHPQFRPLEKKLQDSVAAGQANDSASDTTSQQTEDAATESEDDKPWYVGFKPFNEIMIRGNDPMLLVREVQMLGDAKTTVSTDAIPDWSELNPTHSYMSWQIELHSDASEGDIREIFEWVEEFDCELSVSKIAPVTAEPEAAEEVAPEATNNTDNVVPIADAETKQNAAPTKPAAPPKKKPAADTTIRISTDKIDDLINLVGELVITQSMLSRFSMSDNQVDLEEFQERMAQQERNIRELQESVMRVRMLPLSFAFNRLPRLVRDLSKKLDKKIELITEGAGTELDKTVLESIMDPLVHLVRNSLDHGLEEPEERLAAGKPETGELLLRASHQGGSVVIEIIDDGRGINRERVRNKAIEAGVISTEDKLSDQEIDNLIFAPGFSTAEEVTDVSGRGVGMDVVRRNIADLNGQVEIESIPGKGTTISIRLPLTLAILDGQVVRVANQEFILPILAIVETIEIEHAGVATVPDTGEVCRFRGEYLPVIRLRKLLDMAGDTDEGKLVVIVESHGKLIGVVIDDVIGQQQVVIKTLEQNYKAVPGFAGATIMSDGSVALILDPPSFATEAIQKVQEAA
ncbi:MAG: chemotaxis protein CheA [Granulosicoccaceae bacterium]